MNAPLDPNSSRGRELARELTTAITEIEMAIAERRERQQQREGKAA